MRRSLLLLMLAFGGCLAALTVLYIFKPQVETCEYRPPHHHYEWIRFFIVATPMHVAIYLTLAALLVKAANSRRALSGREPAKWPINVLSAQSLAIAVFALLVGLHQQFLIALVPVALAGYGLAWLVGVPGFFVFILLLAEAYRLKVAPDTETLRRWYSGYLYITGAGALVLAPASFAILLATALAPIYC
jgi:hypothetical protein